MQIFIQWLPMFVRNVSGANLQFSVLLKKGLDFPILRYKVPIPIFIQYDAGVTVTVYIWYEIQFSCCTLYLLMILATPIATLNVSIMCNIKTHLLYPHFL